MQVANIITALLAEVQKGASAKFASLTYRAKETSELAKHHVILNCSTEALYQKDIAKLNLMIPDLSGIALIAAKELLASREESLAKGIGNNSQYVHGPDAGDTYVHVDGMKNVRVHKESGLIYVTGLCESKTVIEPGVYKTVNSSAKTLAKNLIRKELPSYRFRQYVLRNVCIAGINGDVLEVTDDWKAVLN